jgi:DNA-binding response OmpR family regulator
MHRHTRSAGSILIVEDNRSVSEMLGGFLEGQGFEVDYAYDGIEGYSLAAENRYDAIVLDWNLPRRTGFEVCRLLRHEARCDTPILMLSARDTLDDKLNGLEVGADDYLTKPFSVQEIEARLRAVIRRSRHEQGNDILVVGDLALDPVSHTATRAGQALAISPIGLKMLHILMRESPRVVSRQQLEREIWGNSLPDSDTLRSHLYNLRRAVDRQFEVPMLHTVQSAGYRIIDIREPIVRDAETPRLASH